jgi:hypothetical protein
LHKSGVPLAAYGPPDAILWTENVSKLWILINFSLFLLNCGPQKLFLIKSGPRNIFSLKFGQTMDLSLRSLVQVFNNDYHLVRQRQQVGNGCLWIDNKVRLSRKKEKKIGFHQSKFILPNGKINNQIRFFKPDFIELQMLKNNWKTFSNILE